MVLGRKSSFSLPFPSLRTMTREGSTPYIVGAMFTADYAERAARLASSCAKFSLPYEMHEVPTVHRSMGINGTDDLRFTKANFVLNLLIRYRRPVLYLDADCEFVSQPLLISDLVRDRCDFAIYNWLADEYTDAFYPYDPESRYFAYSGSIDFHSTDQLIAAGCTQFYGNSFAARALLSRWLSTIAEFSGSADDSCMNFMFNNSLGKRDWLRWILRKYWLPKAYARYRMWPYVEPVINHPDLHGTSARFPGIRDPRGRKLLYASRAKKRVPHLLFPRDCIIDTKEGMLCKLIDGKIAPVEKMNRQFWV